MTDENENYGCVASQRLVACPFYDRDLGARLSDLYRDTNQFPLYSSIPAISQANALGSSVREAVHATQGSSTAKYHHAHSDKKQYCAHGEFDTHFFA